VKQIRFKPSQYSMTAANGSRINILGERRITFDLNNVSLTMPMLISNDIDEAMLGIDFIVQHRCATDFVRGILQVRGNRIDLHRRGKILDCRRVILNQTVTIPPRTEMDTLIHVPLKNCTDRQNTWLVETKQICPGLLVASIILPNNTDTVTRLCNISSEPRRLEAQTVIARAVAAELVPHQSPHASPAREEDMALIIAKITENLPVEMTVTHRQYKDCPNSRITASIFGR
jgi:hypothetical protein